MRALSVLIQSDPIRLSWRDLSIGLTCPSLQIDIGRILMACVGHDVQRGRLFGEDRRYGERHLGQRSGAPDRKSIDISDPVHHRQGTSGTSPVIVNRIAVISAARSFAHAPRAPHQYTCSGITSPPGAIIRPQASSAATSIALFRTGLPATFSEY
jgi:hypothetical protein